MQGTCPRDALAAEAACSDVMFMPCLQPCPLGGGQHWGIFHRSWEDAGFAGAGRRCERHQVSVSKAKRQR